jgi:TolB-like protein
VLHRANDAESDGALWSNSSRRATPETLSIAVLPLANLSGEVKWERLADGISGDIIADLARLNESFVIARNSSFAYKNKPVDVRQIGKELGVRYVLEGSLQAGSKNVRVTAELVDTATGSHVWAGRYDRPQGDLFVIQDEITDQVVNTIGGWGGRLARAGRDAVKRKPPASLESYDLYLLGIEQKHRFSREGVAEAIRLFSRAVELDPGFARAWTALALAHCVTAQNGFTHDVPAAERHCRECVEKALALDPFDPKTRIFMADLQAQSGDLAAAAEDYRQALASSIGDADTLALAAGSLALVIGDPNLGTELARRAIRLNPNTPSWYFSMLGRTEYVRAAYKESIAAMQHAPPSLPATLLFLAIAHAQMNEIEEAQRIVSRLRTEFPNFTVQGFVSGYPVTNPVALAAIREGASKAGLLF